MITSDNILIVDIRKTFNRPYCGKTVDHILIPESELYNPYFRKTWEAIAPMLKKGGTVKVLTKNNTVFDFENISKQIFSEQFKID